MKALIRLLLFVGMSCALGGFGLSLSEALVIMVIVLALMEIAYTEGRDEAE